MKHINHFFIVMVLGIVLGECKPIPQKKPPNIILILADDLGWKDTRCYGSSFYDTAAIDQLAMEGIRFTNAYSPHPVCGPSRASLLSGKWPLRLGNTGVIGNLPSSEKTVAEALKEVGYATFFTGKWHVGSTDGRDPLNQGFDYALGTNTEGQPGSYFYPYKDKGQDWTGKSRKIIPARDVGGLENGQAGEYLIDRLTNETINFIEQQQGKPFFVYLSHYAVHTPLEGKKEYIEYFRNKNTDKGASDSAKLERIENRAFWRKNQSNPIYAAMVKSLDESVGKIMASLEDLDLSDNTIIIFTSDNGGLSTLDWEELNIPTTNLPLKYGKGWVYEGGIRIPTIIKWPQKVKNEMISDSPISLYDLYPTILDMACIQTKPKQQFDGVSLLPIFNNEKPLDRKMYWYYPHKHGSGHLPSAAIRDKNYKLIWHINEDKTELYKLKKDISETQDISPEYPEVTSYLKQDLVNWIENTKNESP